MRKLRMYIWLIIILLCSGTVYAATNVTVSIDNSSSTYISSGASSDVNVNLSGWEIWVRSTTIGSISNDDITKLPAGANGTSGSATFNLSDGNYFVGAVYFNKSGDLYAPRYMGVYNDSTGDLMLEVPSNGTNINISDFSQAGAVRGYVKDTSGNGINGATVTVVSGPYMGLIPPGYSITTNGSGYYSIFLPVEANVNVTTFTLEVSVAGYTPQTFDVNVTQGMGANTSEFEDDTNLSSSPSSPTPPPSSGGGGGGGGSPTSFEVWIKDLLAGQTFELDIDDKDIPYINGLSLTAKQDIYSSKLSITDYDKKPWSSMEEPDAGVSRYFRVSYTKNTYVESAKLRFSANKSWLKDNDIDPNSVLLYHYTTSWGELDSEILKEDDENIYFEATTSKFSYFSIGGEVDSGYKPLVEEEEVSPTPEEEEEKPVEPPEIETPTPAPPVETPEPEQEPVKAPEASEEEGGICGPTTILLISVLSLLAIRGRYKR